MVQLKTACLCFSLRTGNIIIGWLSVIGGLLAVAIVGYIVAALEQAQVEPDKEDEKKKMLIVLYIALAAVCLSPLFGVCHLYGSYKNRRGFLMPYLVVGGIQLVLTVASILSSLALGQGASQIIGQIIGFAINVYLYLIVLSFYRELRDGTQPRQQQYA